MVRVCPFLVVLVTASTILIGGAVRAAPEGESEDPRPIVEGGSMPGMQPPPVTADLQAPKPAAPARVYGLALRARWVSVPHWLLGLFTKHSIPLSTFGHFGIEGFFRQHDFDIVVALSYQNMSPPDGNWLGSGRNPEFDTRFLQFRGISLYSADISFIRHGMLTSWFGMHGGAGLGVGLLAGSLFVNVSQGCTNANLDDLSACHPPGLTCVNGVCTTNAGFVQVTRSDIFPLIPIVNVVFGLDFRLPNVNGWEAKLEAGFFDAFFAGLGVGYTF